MKRVLALLPLAVFAVLLAVLAWFNFHKKERYEPTAMVGQSVPSVVLTDLDDGGSYDLKTLAAGYKGPILVNMFASWCVPCLSENPQLMALKARGVPIVGIAWKDADKDTRNFLNQHDDPYVHTLSDPDGRMAVALGISGVPETFVVQPDGTISDKIPGPVVPQSVDSVYAAVTKGQKVQ
ncbi:redoxin family protein [Asticcacaulis solisilvae]|uniref:redoxin family protein n=1 Tax=Asticcacaulis solisilvae TaxID=1217274 RepID=UPI003FD8B078